MGCPSSTVREVRALSNAAKFMVSIKAGIRNEVQPASAPSRNPTTGYSVMPKRTVRGTSAVLSGVAAVTYALSPMIRTV